MCWYHFSGDWLSSSRAVAGWVAGRLKACHVSTNIISANAPLIKNYSAAVSGLWPWGGSSPATHPPSTLLASVTAALAPSRFGALRLPCSQCCWRASWSQLHTSLASFQLPSSFGVTLIWNAHTAISKFLSFTHTSLPWGAGFSISLIRFVLNYEQILKSSANWMRLCFLIWLWSNLYMPNLISTLSTNAMD